MSITLENLEMTSQELEASKAAVQKMAYLNWIDAGSPPDGQDEFWLKAEREWIERNYVPHRTLDGTRPSLESRPFAVTLGDRQREEPSGRASRRVSARVKVQ